MSPRATLSSSSSHAIRPRPAPSAARTASSCCRPSALTSNRFATLVQAISITTPMVPITTHSTLPTLPMTSCFERTNRGRDFPRLLIKVRSETSDLRRPGVLPDRQHPLHVRIRLRDGNPRLEPGDSLETETSQVLLVAVKGERRNHIEIGIHQLESLRHDADDFPRLRIDRNAAPDHGSVSAEAALPIAVAEHDSFRTMRISDQPAAANGQGKAAH